MKHARKKMSKKRKKPTRSKLVKKLDIVFSQYVRMSNANSQGVCTCVTCGKQGYWKSDGIQAGHFMSRRHFSTRWDESNVLPQCIKCNMYTQGEQYKYSLHLGVATSDLLLKKSREIVKFSTDELEDMIKKYEDLVKMYNYA
tara:strand:+ start:1306 stop:1731 length:426 start_codon:yes stop_codon:yes gene_type:complete